MTTSHARLFEPTTIGSLRVKNRYAMAPMGPLGLATAEGGWNQRGIEYYTARARGGIGMIITGVCQVTNPAEDLPSGLMPNPVLSPAHFLATSRELTERIHAYDSSIVLQAGAGFGRVVMPAVISPGHDPVAPSPVPYRWDPRVTCRQVTRDEIHAVVENFKVVAGLAKHAGYDAIQVHAVHEGYLLDQFAIERFNQRTDEYGGSLENRLRFAREIVEAIHEAAGDDFPVQLRYSLKSMMKDWNIGGMPGEEFREAGRDIDEGVEAAKLLWSYGYEAFDLDVGCYDAWYWNHPPMYQEKGLYMPYGKILKDAVPGIPVIMAGRLDNPDLALRAIDDGVTDIVSLGRPALADPEIVNKIRAGHTEAVRPCISCHEGCLGRIGAYTQLACAVNPEAAREYDRVLLPTPARRRQKVMIIGGGLAGMESARVLAERGHEPVIFEKGAALGGVVIAGGQPSFKEDDLALIAWYEHELAELGVEIHLNTEVTPQMVRDTDADHLIVAAGSFPRVPPIDFGALPVTEATQALMDQGALGQRVAIIGGGLTGCELALSLRERDADVTIIEVEDDILEKNAPLCAANHDMLHDLVSFRGVHLLTGARAQGASADGTAVVVALGGAGTAGDEADAAVRTVEVPVDSVVTATGYGSEQSLWSAIQDSPLPRHLLGDARRVSNIMYAIWDAYEVASKL